MDQTYPTVIFDNMYHASYLIRDEIERNFGWMEIRTSYKPTNWDVEDDLILDGWKEEAGTCERCWTLRSANGSCEC